MMNPNRRKLAENLVAKAVNFDEDPETIAATLQRAQVEATLAIAQEKHTANLIAYAVLTNYPIPDHLRAEIEHALEVVL